MTVDATPVPFDASACLWRGAVHLTEGDVDAHGRLCKAPKSAACTKPDVDVPKIAPSVRRAARRCHEVSRLRKALATAQRHNHLLEAALRLSESSKRRVPDQENTAAMPAVLLTRYEVARIIGLRALQLDKGAAPRVTIEDETLRCDALYVAARELAAGVLDAKVRRADADVHVRDARMPPELHAVLDTKDGRSRGAYYASSSDS